MKDAIIVFIATATYTGYAPKAPGTVGTLWGVVIAYFMCGLGAVPQALIILGVLGLTYLWHFQNELLPTELQKAIADFQFMLT